MEKQILELIARDRIEIPLSSMDNKLRRLKSASAKDLAGKLGSDRFDGERTYAFVETEDKDRARGMKEAIAEFSEEFPKYGEIIRGKIAEKRAISEEHLYFDIKPGCKLTSSDYVHVMTDLGLSEGTAKGLYPDLMDVSRKLERKRNEERSIIVGKYSN